MKKDDGENIGPLDGLSLSSKSLSGNNLMSNSADRKVNMNKT